MKTKIAKGTLYIITILTFLIVLVSLAHPFLTPAKYSDFDNSEVIGSIDKDSIINQKFVSLFDDLDYIEVKYTNFDKKIKQGEMTVEIYNNNAEKIYYNELDLSQLENNSFLRFEFDIQKKVKGKEFRLVLTVKNLQKNSAFSFYQTVNGNQLSSNNLNLINSIGMTFNGENNTYHYSFILLLPLFIELFIIFIIKFKNAENVEYKNKKIIIKILYFSGLILSSLLFAYTFMDVKNDLLRHNTVPILSLPIFILSATIILANIAYHIRAKNIKLENLFLALAIPFACLYLLCIIPGEAPDENYHYREAYKVSIGDFLFQTNKSPLVGERRYSNYGEVKNNLLKVDEESDEMMEHSTLIYSPLLYLASGFGVFIGHILNLTVLGTKYVGSFFNMLLFLITGYYTIKLLPYGKYFGIVYLLSPMYLQQATSLSGDAVINATCLLFIAYILNLRHSEKKLEIKDIIVLSILVLFVLISKNAYFPLLLLLLLIRKNVKSMDKKKKIVLIGCLLLSFSIYYCTYNYVLKNKEIKTVAQEVIETPQHEISKPSYLFSSPTKFIYLILNTLNINLDFYILSFAGQYLGWLDLQLKSNVIILYLLLFVVSIFFDLEKSKLNNKDRIIMITALIINIAAVMAGLYFNFGDGRGFLIEGVQGRYFIPIIILFFLMLGNKKIELRMENKRLFLASTLLYIHICAILTIVQHFGI